MPGEGRVVLPVSAPLATPAPFGNQFEFPPLPSGLLAGIVLVTSVGAAVLTDPPTEAPLAPLQQAPTRDAMSLWP